MPNWTINDISIKGNTEQLAKIKMLLRTDDHVFDFDKIVPMPKALQMRIVLKDLAVEYACANGDSEKAKILEKYNISFPNPLYQEIQSAEDLEKLGNQYLENKKNYGAANWYDWRCQNWGTKWNAEDASLDEENDGTELHYHFMTAWAEPVPIYLALSEQFPDVTICTTAIYEFDDIVQCSTFQNGKEIDFYEKNIYMEEEPEINE